MNVETEKLENENYPTSLSLGGKPLVGINKSVEQFDDLQYLNYVYVNSPTLGNVSRAKYKIDPTTFRIDLGQARIKHQTGDWAGQLKDYNIYINAVGTSAQGSSSGTDKPDNNPNGGSGGGGDSGITVEWVNEAIYQAIENRSLSGNITENSDGTKLVNVSQVVAYVNEKISGGGGSEDDPDVPTSDFKTTNQYHQLYELLDVFDVVYDNVYNTDNSFSTLSSFSALSSGMNIAAFTFKYDNTQSLTGLNCIRIPALQSSIDRNIYCVIRKCKVLYESTSAGSAPSNFQDYLSESTVVATSKNSAKLIDSHYQWYFPKPFNLILSDSQDYNTIYLVTFHISKYGNETWSANTVQYIVTNRDTQSSSESNLQWVWNNSVDTDGNLGGGTKASPLAIFCYKNPIGAIVK